MQEIAGGGEGNESIVIDVVVGEGDQKVIMAPVVPVKGAIPAETSSSHEGSIRTHQVRRLSVGEVSIGRGCSSMRGAVVPQLRPSRRPSHGHLRDAKAILSPLEQGVLRAFPRASHGTPHRLPEPAAVSEKGVRRRLVGEAVSEFRT